MLANLLLELGEPLDRVRRFFLRWLGVVVNGRLDERGGGAGGVEADAGDGQHETACEDGRDQQGPPPQRPSALRTVE